MPAAERTRALFVAPSESSSGEAVTALHMAEALVAAGGEVAVVAAPQVAPLFARLPAVAVEVLGSDPAGGSRRRRRWDRLLARFDPRVVVFADYPLLFTASGTPPLADDGWVAGLDRLDAALVTLDHLGYAQRRRTVFFGPPHLVCHAQTFPEPPARMELLLPAPMHEPGPVAGRRGRPFRCWTPPLGLPAERRRAVRRRWLGERGGRLVVHAVPRWGWEMCERLGLPFYRHLTRLLEIHLVDHVGAGEPVTVVSVNRGDLLPPSGRPGLEVRNLPSLAKDDFEELLFAADLMLTENGVSSSLGKAIAAAVPCALLRNRRRLPELAARTGAAAAAIGEVVQAMERERPGAVFPFDVFPLFTPDEIAELGLYRDNSVTEAFAALELFDPDTGPRLGALLDGGAAGRRLGERQRRYAERVAALPDAVAALAAVTATAEPSRPAAGEPCPSR